MTTAMVTASYAGDFDRCRLLCDTLDAHVTGHAHHYILVAGHDVPQFEALAGPGRSIVDERDLLPARFLAIRDPLSGFSRHVWLSATRPPLRGWHVQQLRRLAIARHLREDVFVYCDSDVAFVRTFDVSAFRQGSAITLYRKDAGLEGLTGDDHAIWWRNAGMVLGLDPQARPMHDYISTLIAWRRDTLSAMLDRIEETSGRSWIDAVTRNRKFSECTLYGRFADELEAPGRHVAGSRQFCAVRWSDPLRSGDDLRDMIAKLEPYQVAIGIQSFLGMPVEDIRSIVDAIG